MPTAVPAASTIALPEVEVEAALTDAPPVDTEVVEEVVAVLESTEPLPPSRAARVSIIGDPFGGSV